MLLSYACDIMVMLGEEELTRQCSSTMLNAFFLLTQDCKGSMHKENRQSRWVLIVQRKMYVGPFRSLEFLTSGTSDVIPFASSLPKILLPFSAVCFTVFMFEFSP